VFLKLNEQRSWRTPIQHSAEKAGCHLALGSRDVWEFCNLGQGVPLHGRCLIGAISTRLCFPAAARPAPWLHSPVNSGPAVSMENVVGCLANPAVCINHVGGSLIFQYPYSNVINSLICT
jgi:hypothetical protein